MKIKKIIKTSLLVMAIAICVLGGIKMNEQLKIKNVFDEMYYTEISDMKKPPGKRGEGFPMMKQIKSWDRKGVQRFDDLTLIYESYKDEYVDPGESLTFFFEYVDKLLSFGTAKEIDDGVFLQISFDYWVEKQVLEESIGIALSDMNLPDPETEEEIRAYLEKYDISTDYLKEKADAILYETVVKDWTAHYDSRFSVDDLGKVTIEKDAFLK